jgi:hypothetical protein
MSQGGEMPERVTLDEIYYAEPSQSDSLWLVYSVERGPVGSYATAGGPNWNHAMLNEDKGRVTNLLQEKVDQTARRFF